MGLNILGCCVKNVCENLTACDFTQTIILGIPKRGKEKKLAFEMF
jgi:hypothetical protein